jgi:ligand-binding sensor domain-containing protein/DNA-binding CsgD family transcriptional regulator
MTKFNIYIQLLVICFFYALGTVNAQSLPPVAHYSIEDYEADNQNWSITQAQDGTMYFANGKGLLKFDGEHWDLLGSPNNTILRSVYAVENKVYTGAYMEFGVWQKNKVGVYKYKSLSENLELIEDEQFWTITSLENFIIFQSLDAVYMYDTLKGKTISISGDGEITKMVVVDNELYFHTKNLGLFKLVNGKKRLLNDSQIIRNSTLINIYNIDNQLYAQTQFNGIINLSNNKEYFPKNFSGNWSDLSVYSSIQKQNGDIFLGTISNGLFKISNDNIVYHLNQKNTLSNNTVLSIFNDNSDNIWLGLDNGINIIDDDSNISIFNDKNGQLGTIYTSVTFKDTLYVGSNQGLFYYDKDVEKFLLVDGTNGQVWSLFIFNDTLFCGHHNGTYVINNKTSYLLDKTRGTWAFRVNDKNTLVSGNYDGLYIYKYENGWQLDRKIKGFNISTQYFEFIDAQSILVNHEYKGLFKLVLDNKLNKVEKIETIKSVDKGLFSSIVKFKDKILYAYQAGIFIYDKNKQEFSKDSILSDIIDPKSFSTGKMVITKDEKLWLFNKTDIVNVSESSIENQFLINKIPISDESRRQISGYENISYDGKNTYLLGGSDGFLKINLDEDFKYNSNIHLTKISVYNKNNEKLNDFDLAEIKNNYNNLKIQISSLNFNPLLKSEYQFMLNGYNNKWSEWQENTQLSFKNLKYGDYNLNIRSRIGEDNVSEVSVLDFSIQKPFYLSTAMILLYAILAILLGVSIHLLYKSYYKKQKLAIQLEADRKLKLKELEAQKEIMQMNNKQLKQDIENKNRELAISTMSLIKKNEFLSQIHVDLKPLKSSNSKIKKVVKSIDSNINSKDDWKFFEEAFNNADKDFFKKLKEIHPSLTHNDFKLCAYLRLNLSSKEIAPLFNISTKSVEIKRYRLRKKMNLDRDQSLTDYILAI